jgi:hypothetical protein
MKNDNQTLLKKRERVMSMNADLTADQRTFEELGRYWQLEVEEMQGRMGRIA